MSRPVQIRKKLAGEHRMTITPSEGHTFEEVLGKINNRQVRFEYPNIVEEVGGVKHTIATIGAIEDHTLAYPWTI